MNPAILRGLARQATLIENRTPQAREILRNAFARRGHAWVFGITGPPGVGKSTLTSALVTELRHRGKSVAVLAVDPSSPFTGGAILGDRVRMQQHHADPQVFIRSLATRGMLGGLASPVLDLTILLDAAGFDVILVETVGVGQDGIDIARVAGRTAVVLAPNLGDEIQAIKAGLLEIADLFVLNKADLAGIDQLRQSLEDLHVPTFATIASTGTGVREVVDALLRLPSDPSKQVILWKQRLLQMFRESAERLISESDLSLAAHQVAAHQQDPYSILDNWRKRVFRQENLD